jgi:hypothetical protein
VLRHSAQSISTLILISLPAGVSTRLYEEFLKPLLLVALFAPPEELSAGAVLGAFYYYIEYPSTFHSYNACPTSVPQQVRCEWS